MNAVNELECGNTPPKLGGVPARTAKREPGRAKPQNAKREPDRAKPQNAKHEPDRAKPQKKSEQAGWFPWFTRT
ncbi:MAG: hypothetical protein DMG16_13730 [Acidobacteria bacterium]|nr:MAG: hypothetical protein DMG16_13730 [Acidobacteriota bacterium]